MKFFRILLNENSKLLLIVLLASLVSYFIDFYLGLSELDSFWCVNLIDDFNLPFDSTIKFPIHCDEGPYQKAVTDLEFFFSSNNPYQKRPLWIMALKIINFIMSLLLGSSLSEYQVFRIATVTTQIIILFTISKLFSSYLKLNLSKIRNYFPILLLITFPSIRWNILFPSHGNLTILALIISLCVLEKKVEFINYNNTSILIFGILSLAHRTFLIYGLLIIVYHVIKNYFFLNSFIKIFILLIPTLLYELFFVFTPYDSFDWNKENYGQFYWIYNLLKSLPTKNSDEFCQKFDTFIDCNIEITLTYLRVSSVFIIYCISMYLLFKICFGHGLSKSNYLLYLSIGMYLFWSFQGWYPNYRFINYSLGYFLLIFAISTIKEINKNKEIGYISILIYFYSIPYLSPYSAKYTEINYLTVTSFIVFIFFTVNVYAKSKSNIKK
jgi:hypothetical protein